MERKKFWKEETSKGYKELSTKKLKDKQTRLKGRVYSLHMIGLELLFLFLLASLYMVMNVFPAAVKMISNGTANETALLNMSSIANYSYTANQTAHLITSAQLDMNGLITSLTASFIFVITFMFLLAIWRMLSAYKELNEHEAITLELARRKGYNKIELVCRLCKKKEEHSRLWHKLNQEWEIFIGQPTYLQKKSD